MKTLLCYLFSAVSALSTTATVEVQEEIRVQLPTNSALTPIYLGKIQSVRNSFSEKYLGELEAILAYDLNYSGALAVMPFNLNKEALLRQRESREAFDPVVWGKGCAIQPVVTEGFLNIVLYDGRSASLKHFNHIPLMGHINQDRRQIHKVADGICKALTGKEGVASTRILYAYQVKSAKAEGGGWTSEIWECDWDGANAKQLTREGSYTVTPVAIPAHARFGSDRFLYVSYKEGQPKIFIASFKEGEGKRLVQLRGNQLLPAISKQRDRLAFICDAGGRTDLFLQPFNPESGQVGKPIQLFSVPNSVQASPSFSPDGSRIAFVSDKDGSPRIYVISTKVEAARGTPTLISKQNHESSCPNWSPDGSKLAYSSRTGGTRQIWIYDFETQAERQLTYGPGNKENPCWAPDSVHLVFNSTDAASSELYVVNLNQAEARRITKGPGKKHYPSWGTAR